METETKTETVAVDSDNGGEGEAEIVSVAKADYDKLNQTLGSLKRELKDLKKPKEETKDTPEKTKTGDNQLLEKAFLRSAQITASDEVELALSTAKKWDMPIDALVDDEDFKAKLEKLRTQKSNELATSKVKSGGGKSQAKDTPEYWLAKGTPPTPEDIPDKKTRQKVVMAFLKEAKGEGKKFYND